MRRSPQGGQIQVPKLRIRAFRGNVNILAKVGSRWVRICRADYWFDYEMFRKLSEYAERNGRQRAMFVYGSRYPAIYYEVEVTVEELGKILGESEIKKIAQGLMRVIKA
ncbi:hypothetical protein [Vulcanisaeta distributa]|uniref:hypothetical protein n=1 Tax=Vulcanisaeta distributa TaxID=164451 RepID=UPI000AC4678D|nr:hypothetical protein [Vulcanisaeta distributa]